MFCRCHHHKYAQPLDSPFIVTLLRFKTLWMSFLICGTFLLESCAHSYRVIPYRTIPVGTPGIVCNGAVYVGVDVSDMNIDSQHDATAVRSLLRTSISESLASSFREAKPVPDIARAEPDSSDIVLIVRPQNPRYPRVQSNIPRSWGRLLLLGVLAEVYDVFSLDLATYRNNAVLPVSGLLLFYYNAIYCYQYQRMVGDYALEYQVFILAPDGTLIDRHQFTDSAKVTAQAEVRTADIQNIDLIGATEAGVSGTIRNLVIADSARIRGISNEMKRSYLADCDRLLTFKRNVYRFLGNTVQPPDRKKD
jgi:hypothetical protein